MSELEFVGYDKMNYDTRTVKEFRFETRLGEQFTVLYDITNNKYSLEARSETSLDKILEAVEWVKTKGIEL